MATSLAVPRRRTSRWLLGCGVLGVVATVTGLVLILTPVSSASFGWFAYVPGSTEVFAPAATALAPLHQTGLIIGVIGLVLVAFGAGWWCGLRGGRPSPSESEQ